jgi:hypothetical protein
MKHDKHVIDHAITTLRQETSPKLARLIEVIEDQFRYYEDPISPGEHSTAGVFLINTMSAHAPRADLLEVFRFKEGEPRVVEAELRINGVEVNFRAAIEDCWGRLSNRFDEATLEKAKELVKASRLRKMQDIIERAEWELSNEIEQLFPQLKA